MKRLAFAAIAVVSGCGVEVEPVRAPEPAPPAARSEPDQHHEEEPDERHEGEDLAALGYVDFAPADDVEPESGVVVRDPRSEAGYDLVVSIPFATGVLFDPDGHEVRRWHDPEAARWLRCELLPDGDVLALGIADTFEEPRPYIARLTWDGEERWRRRFGFHHDVEPTSRGDLVALTLVRRELPNNPNWPSIFDNAVQRLTADGELLGDRSLTDVLELEYSLTDLSIEATLAELPPGDADAFADVLAQVDAFESQEEAAGTPAASDVERATGIERPVDLIHSNSVFWIGEDFARHPLGAADVLVTMRHVDSLAAFDWETGEVVWRWGAGILQGPHEASPLPNHKVLVFDNGIRGRGHSRILEVDPTDGSIDWEWTATPPEDFYCRTRGTAQGLPGGNVLVADSERGVAFEVTRDGDVVWRFVSPLVDEEGRRGAIRIRRYAAEVVIPLLER